MRAAALLAAALAVSAQHPAPDLPGNPPPAWEAKPVEADAPIVPDQIVLVRSGDGLLGIAARTGASAEAIARANALPRPWTLRTNQRLKIPGGRYHLVRPGQSGIAIARAYGIDWSRIATVNALPEPYVLRAGTRLLIPVVAPPRSRAAERAAAFRLDVDDILTGGEPALAPRQAPIRAATRPTRPLPPAAVVAPPPRLAAGGFTWPVESTSIAGRFGAGAAGERNNGIDVAVPLATPVRAAADGVVAYAGTGIPSLGGLVIVRHGGGWTSVYGYAERLLVTRGQSVKRGQRLALSGESGATNRPALHFELRRGRVPVDPVTMLRSAPATG
ncbi:LysM peptidoglycan-binding domain-containing M23 family metallopeptidase [Sphingomonas sp. KR1UV-12]|uniref:LysM peptidoglycan-binding domain-containing M23 family metallopeptidase n=1 Tax=Sphingomonas aurea TaxID=3063994 RepID=A0ABT9EH32_9SPHN|nr:M23 family metallopeptidase [Sphingomonas sp. KR1UV-12]MDP1026268.1 LysM peptidoglycan-binding domain-containing M23 family metallopeptidase [Sphingomonas sp. KR1UV-12]